MKISFYNMRSWEQEYIEGKFKEKKIDAELDFHEEKVDPDHLPLNTEAEILSLFVNSQADAKVIKALPDLKMIATRSTGYDHIDLKACKKKKIVVSTVPSYGENTVAEQAFALLLSISRKIYTAYENVREEGDFSFDELQGFDLKGKTFGVIGIGRIGKHSIMIAKGFGMNVIAYDPFPKEDMARELGFEYKNLDEIFAESDVLTLHVPYMKKTHHLIDAKAIKKMKDGVIIINTSRGAVIDTQALTIALKDGKVGGAGLDVLEEEGVIKDEMDFLVTGSTAGHDLKTIVANHVLIDMPNVIITPHNAFNTKEALMRILDTTIDNIESFIKGTPQNTVDGKR